MKTVSFCTLIVLLVGFIPAGRAQSTAQNHGTASGISSATIAGAHITPVHGETKQKNESPFRTNEVDFGERMAL